MLRLTPYFGVALVLWWFCALWSTSQVSSQGVSPTNNGASPMFANPMETFGTLFGMGGPQGNKEKPKTKDGKKAAKKIEKKAKNKKKKGSSEQQESSEEKEKSGEKSEEKSKSEEDKDKSGSDEGDDD